MSAEAADARHALAARVGELALEISLWVDAGDLISAQLELQSAAEHIAPDDEKEHAEFMARLREFEIQLTGLLVDARRC